LFLQPISRTLSLVSNAFRTVKLCSYGRGRKTERREERKKDISKRQKVSSKKEMKEDEEIKGEVKEVRKKGRKERIGKGTR
jgi:hypothetical protein